MEADIMAEDNGYRYWTDKEIGGLIRTRDDDAQVLRCDTKKWADWNLVGTYANVGGCEWRVLHRELTPSEAKRCAKDEYGLDELPE